MLPLLSHLLGELTFLFDGCPDLAVEALHLTGLFDSELLKGYCRVVCQVRLVPLLCFQ